MPTEPRCPFAIPTRPPFTTARSPVFTLTASSTCGRKRSASDRPEAASPVLAELSDWKKECLQSSLSPCGVAAESLRDRAKGSGPVDGVRERRDYIHANSDPAPEIDELILYLVFAVMAALYFVMVSVSCKTRDPESRDTASKSKPCRSSGSDGFREVVGGGSRCHRPVGDFNPVEIRFWFPCFCSPASEWSASGCPSRVETGQLLDSCRECLCRLPVTPGDYLPLL